MLEKCVLGWDADEDDLLLETVKKKNIGGIIVYAKNIKDNFTAFSKKLRETSVNKNLIICADQEGGSVRRFMDEDIFVMSARESIEFLNPIQYETEVYFMGKRLKEYGIDLVLGPVLDIVTSKENILWERSYGFMEDILKFGEAFISALEKAGVSSCIKHFFGYGLANPDPHGNPVSIERTERVKTSMFPFVKMVSRGYKDFIMTAHVDYEGEIVTYSAKWIKDYLKKSCGFGGKVITDDLMMKSAGDMPLPEKVRKSVEAGCDYCIISGRLVDAVKKLSPQAL